MVHRLASLLATRWLQKQWRQYILHSLQRRRRVVSQNHHSKVWSFFLIELPSNRLWGLVEACPLNSLCCGWSQFCPINLSTNYWGGVEWGWMQCSAHIQGHWLSSCRPGNQTTNYSHVEPKAWTTGDICMGIRHRTIHPKLRGEDDSGGQSQKLSSGGSWTACLLATICQVEIRMNSGHRKTDFYLSAAPQH